MNTFDYLDQTLGKKDVRPAGGNSVMLRNADNSITVTLHNTRIITARADLVVILDNGGWVSPTTTKRINEWVSGFEVKTIGGKMHAVMPNGNRIPFEGHTLTIDQV